MRAIDVKLSLTSIQSNTLGLKVALPAKPNSRSFLFLQTRQTDVVSSLFKQGKQAVLVVEAAQPRTRLLHVT